MPRREGVVLDDGGLIRRLEELGIDRDSYRVLALLPMVLVAWADGKVQKGERKKILDIAREKGFVSSGGEAVLDRWLEKKPTDEETRRGFEILIELARRSRGMGSDMTIESLSELIDFSTEVAAAAGGLFGLGGRISETERQALDEIAETLSVDDGQSWKELLEDLER